MVLSESVWGFRLFLDSACVRFGSGLCRQIVSVSVGAGCAPLVASLFLFCCGDGVGGWGGVVEAFNSTSRYLDDLLNSDGTFFDSMVGRVCPSGLRLSGAGVWEAGVSFLDLNLSLSDGFVVAEVFHRRDDFGFDIVNVLFLDGGLPRSASCGTCFSRLVRFARVSGRVDDIDARNEVLTARLLR